MKTSFKSHRQAQDFLKGLGRLGLVISEVIDLAEECDGEVEYSQQNFYPRRGFSRDGLIVTERSIYSGVQIEVAFPNELRFLDFWMRAPLDLVIQKMGERKIAISSSVLEEED